MAVPLRQDLPRLTYDLGENEDKPAPPVVFVEDVGKFIDQRDPQIVGAAVQEIYNKYQIIYEQLTARKTHLSRKMPDVEQAMESVSFLKTRNQKAQGETMKLRYPIADNCYANAEIVPGDRVCLWLGANVMMEYTLDEAEAMLNKNDLALKETIAKLESDLGFLKDQLTTCEVNIARIHNYMVKIKKAVEAVQPK